MRIKLGVPIELPKLISSTAIEILLPIKWLSNRDTDRDVHKPSLVDFSQRENATFTQAPLITHISCDSRLARQGDLFISLSEDEALAAQYISDARASGAFAICNRRSISDELTPLEKLANYYIGTLPYLKEIVAITGSNGKTTTKEFAKHLLSSEYKVHATNGNMNNEIGLPLTVLSAPADTEVLVLEMGMNQSGEISRLSRTVSPTIAAITNIGTAHIGNLGSAGAIKEAKLEIVEGLNRDGVLITRADDNLNALKFIKAKHSTYSYNKQEANACLMRLDSGKYCFRIDGRAYSFDFFTELPHILENLALALSIGFYAKTDPRKLVHTASLMNEELLRYKITSIGDITLIDDAYNASMESIAAALDVLRRCECKIRSVLVGDILEAGAYSEEIHYKLGCMIAGVADRLYIVGEMADFIKRGALESRLSPSSIFIVENSYNISDIARTVLGLVSGGECMLIKGSHRTGLHKFKEEFERLINNAD